MAWDTPFGLGRRVCVVTGGASDIGRAIALALAAEGARVAILDSSRDGAEETARLVVAAGAQALAQQCDTADPASVAAARAAVEDGFGVADVLVNHAATSGSGALADLALEEWHRLLSANLTGYFLCSQLFGRPMRERGEGVLVHLSSIAAERPLPASGSYGVATAGATMLARLLAAEWGPAGIRSNAVHPGLVQASSAEPGLSDGAGRRAAAVPLGRLAEPADVAQAVLFLASPRAAYVNGAELLVDGGLSRNLTALVPRFD